MVGPLCLLCASCQQACGKVCDKVLVSASGPVRHRSMAAGQHSGRLLTWCPQCGLRVHGRTVLGMLGSIFVQALVLSYLGELADLHLAGSTARWCATCAFGQALCNTHPKTPQQLLCCLYGTLTSCGTRRTCRTAGGRDAEDERLLCQHSCMARWRQHCNIP